MSATNDFVPFCPTDTGTNLLEQSAYLADAQLPIGNQPGVARLQLVNKALRQATYIASCVAQFLANTTGNNVLDDATPAEVLTTMAAAFKSPPNVQVITASGTYTVPTNALYLEVEAIGAGGGGGGSTSSSDGGNGGAGGNTTFGTGASQIIAGGGGGGPGGTTGGGQHSGTGSSTGQVGTGNAGIVSPGSDGAPVQNVIVNTYAEGGNGGAGPWGGGGAGGGPGATGTAGKANTGSGGGGAGFISGNGQSGAGGGAGAYVQATIPGPLAATYAVVIGAAGTAGTAGSGGTAGSTGGTGVVKITARFQ